MLYKVFALLPLAQLTAAVVFDIPARLNQCSFVVLVGPIGSSVVADIA